MPKRASVIKVFKKTFDFSVRLAQEYVEEHLGVYNRNQDLF